MSAAWSIPAENVKIVCAAREQYLPQRQCSDLCRRRQIRRTDTGRLLTHIVVTEDFVVRIPDNIGLDAAAPLLCAGITTYSPLNRWQAGPGKKVAVIGLGGLGHMGVKIAHAMGAEVTVLSQTLSKKEDGLKFGAQHYYATKDPETFKELAGTFDLIINTVSAAINLDAYLGLLKLDGTLVNVGAPGEPLSVNVMSLIGHRRSFAGSMIGGIRETQEMLDFCAEHGIVPNIEVISADPDRRGPMNAYWLPTSDTVS